jgi:carboxymethylenebutenolidase
MNQSQPDGYLALSPGGKGPGVLVLHAWWGLNATIKSTCQRLAEEGFVVFAPDLYHGKVADTISGAEALGSALDTSYQQARAEVAQASRYLSGLVSEPGGELAVIGFSLGAFYALDLADAEPETIRKVILFYGTGGGDFSHSKAAFLGHFAGDDPYEPPDNVDSLEQALKQAGCPVTFYRYPGTGHWFFEPDRREAYNPQAASLAWARTLAFLKSATGG